MLLTCVMSLVFMDSVKTEYAKRVPVACYVIEKSPIYNEFGEGYRHLKIDCETGMKKYRLAKNESNKLVRWIGSTDCYNLEEK